MLNKTKKVISRILAMALVAVLLVGEFPTTVMAAISDVPIATNLQAVFYEDSNDFSLDWDAIEVGSGDATFEVQVLRKKTESDTTATYEVVDTIPYAQRYYTYVPKRTGFYTFRVRGKSADGRYTEYAYSEADQYVFVPLAKPEVIMRQGSELMSITWSGDPERVVSYDLAYRKADPSEKFLTDENKVPLENYSYTKVLTNTTQTSYKFTNLELNQYYYFQITAHADDGETSVAYANGYFIKNDAGKTFTKTNMGTGAKAGTVSGDLSKGLTIAADGSKFADSEDGFTYYYTKIPANENFILTATFTMLDASAADNQSAIGIIATDIVGTTVDTKYFNSITCGACKLIPPTTGGQAVYRVPGVRYVTGYLDSLGKVPYDPSITTGNPPGLRNMNNKFTFDKEQFVPFENGYTYTFTLRKSNTGYEGTMSGSDGTCILYDVNSLLKQDSSNMYVGFFAARNVSVKVSDIVMTKITPANDEAKVNPPVVYLDRSVSIMSPSHATSYNYNFVYRPNISGTLTVKDDSSNVIVNKVHLDNGQYYEKAITLGKKSTTFTTTFTPDKTQPLKDYSDIVNTKTVTVNSFGKPGDTLVVTPSGSANGTGSEEHPLDIYTAVAYAQPGQTILLKSGTYNLMEKLTIERGHNGTAQYPINIVADCVDNIVADQDNGLTDAKGVKLNLAGLDMTNGTAFEVAGDYWNIYGLEIYATPHDVKTIQVSGNHNTLEMLLVHDVGNSGIQISGSSKETIEHWPSYNTILNCEVYNCCDDKRNDADGFAAKLTSGVGNVFEGCISHHNIDDGWDLYAKSTTGLIGEVLIKNCVTYSNGILTSYGKENNWEGEGNGFKLGGESMPVDHKLVNSITFNNGAKGVTSNSNPNAIIDGVICYNNAFTSAAENFSLYTNSARNTKYSVSNLVSMSKNTAKQDKRSTVKEGSVTAKSAELDSAINFFFNGKTSTNSAGVVAKDSTWFKNIDTTIIPTRNADGSINMHGLLEPTSTMLGYVSFDYAALQGTTGTITNIADTVDTLLEKAISDENGTPTAITIVKAPTTTLDGAPIDLTGCQVKITYSNGRTETKSMLKTMLNKSIFYIAEGKTQTVTVSVAADVKATFTVTVLDKTPIELVWDVAPATTVSKNGTLNVTGAKLLVKYSNNTYEYVDITSSMVSLNSANLGAAVATITYEGLTITHNVTVVESTKPITGISVSASTASLTVGDTKTITATITPSDTSDGTIVDWTSSNTSVATVSGGKITAVAAGSAVITASVQSSTQGTLTAKCTVTVTGTSGGGGTSGGEGQGGGSTASGDAEVYYYGCGNEFFKLSSKSGKTDKITAGTFEGTEVTLGLKLNSDSYIESFTVAAEADVVIYAQGAKSGTKFAIMGGEVKEEFTTSTSMQKYTATIPAGTYSVQRTSGETYLVYMSVTPKSTAVHTHSYGEGEVTKAATCTATGVMTYTCECGDKKTETIPVVAHSYNSGSVTKAATCIATGEKSYVCVNCGNAKVETIAKTAHTYATEFTVDTAATATTAGSKSRHCTTAGCTAKTDVTTIPATGTTVRNGLCYVNGAWGYYKNNVIDTTFKGFAEANGSQWLIENGTIKRVSGYYNDGTDIYVVVDGKLDTTKTDLLYVNQVWYYFRNGKVDWTYTSLAYANNAWWYVKNGKLDKTYTGLVPFRNQMWYVTAGKLDKTYVGSSIYNGVAYDVKDGIGTKKASYTGLAYAKGVWVYLTNGVPDSTYKGVTTYNGTIWFVENGTLSKKSGVWEQDGEIYWIVEGKVDPSIYALKHHNGSWYYFRGGVVDWTYNDLAYANDAWWYIKNGSLDKSYTGLYLFRNQLWYINAGKLDKSYTGTVTYQGKTYTVANGLGTLA